MSFKSYKPDQAKPSRMVTLVSGWFLTVWGAKSLALALPAAWRVLGESWNQLLMDARAEDAWTLDLVVIAEMKFSPALTFALVAALGICLWWWRFLNRPRWAEMLIEMETELRKVSWPSTGDAWQSTLVVTGCTVLLVITMFAYDIVIKGVIDLIAGGA